MDQNKEMFEDDLQEFIRNQDDKEEMFQSYIQ